MLGWLRENLFSSPGNIALTLICILFIAWAVPPLLRFFLLDAVWSGSDREACLASPANPDPGACWAFVRVWFSYFVYGFYPIVRTLARRCVLRGAGIRHRLARLAVGAAPRPWRRLFLRRAAGFVLCPFERRAAPWTCRRSDRAVGRHPGHHRRRDGRHRRLPAARHFAGARPPLRYSGRQTFRGDLYRIRPRRAADHRPVHGERHAAAVRSRNGCRRTSSFAR